MGNLINGRAPEEIVAAAAYCAHSTGCFVGSCPYFDCDDDIVCDTALMRDLLAYAQHLEAQQPKWISVKEQEPVFPCLYWDGVNTPAVAKSLVAITLKDGKEVFVADVLLEVFPEALQGLLEDCTHILYWMPLPSTEDLK